MELETYRFTPGNGWDREPDHHLDSPNTLVLFFGAPDYSLIEDGVSWLEAHFAQSVILGCSSAGEIFGDELSLDCLVVAVLRFRETRLRVARTKLAQTSDSSRVGHQISSALLENDLQGILVLSEGLSVNGSQLIDGINSALPKNITVTGGLAGDDDRFERTWVWHDGLLSSKLICALGLYGSKISIGHGSKGGWDLLGHEREVTRSVDNILYELDGQPALDIYKRYLGDRASGLPATGLLFPLSMRDQEATDDPKVRTILAVDETEQSITFAGDIPQGSFVRLMRANFDRLIDGAASAVEEINLSRYHAGPILCIAISCVGRRLVLGERTEEEIEATLEGLPGETRQIGFYSYGELSPLSSGRCDLHNQTMTLTLIWEDE